MSYEEIALRRRSSPWLACSPPRSVEPSTSTLERQEFYREAMEGMLVPQHGDVRGAPLLSEHFTGRDDEVRKGLALLTRKRLVTVHGLPGTGKTELARKLAEDAVAAEDVSLTSAAWRALDGLTEVGTLRGLLALDFSAEKAEDDAAPQLPRNG